ncbi:MAG: hypothetical protein ACREAB_18020, partial [Blastocatellia bacterium]
GWLGHPVFVGYHTWPNMGYNAPLSPADIRDLPPELRGARDLQDLFDLPGGSEWWRTYGQGQDMIFDLDERSKSMRRFFIYLADKQRRL